MADNELYRIEKIFSDKAKEARSLNKPMTIQNPLIQHADKAEKSATFKNIYTNYLHEVGKADQGVLTQQLQRNELKVAMDEAEKTFDSMMQIRGEIDKAFKELMQLQV